ncbi:hypothetical protein LO772_18340 [Yinghuangia sp. ASG 101]|uniref:hypothetical protein n=1 Tax=Yinghuangia sp. ASG 101 TaxID=2896848 RepID=UPI001E4CFCF1|nr:hypothetical protein [Yinghuangia sp. ASG 101]UGQ08942.1 hypothetical protein LO772_18340 [Yinghuangia sp. ASG 101]
MLLSEISSLCASASKWPGLLSDRYGVCEVHSEGNRYTIPEVQRISTCMPVSPQLLLITAPAAVGKSAAAAHMSRVLKAPLLDLSTLQVGDGTLEGSLSKAMGAMNFAQFFGRLSEGKATLVVDALDEAEVRSGQANFQAFVRGLTETALTFSGKPSIILLSRVESTRYLTSVFDDRGLAYEHYEILPFSRAQAESYLDHRMTDVYTARQAEPVHQKHSGPFAAVRDQIFVLLSSALAPASSDPWQSEEVRPFLGYAPVLDVVAEFLAVDNFVGLQRELTSKKTNEALPHWDLVAQVIDDLLLREQHKLTSQFCETVEFSLHGNDLLAGVLYTPEEQCARLLDLIENLGITVSLPAHLPDRLRDSYDAAVSAQLMNHPFLRGTEWFNVIFRDYVTARALSSPTTSSLAAKNIRTRLLSPEWKHSPMFGYFASLLWSSPGDAMATCHSEVFGALYESFKSMCEARDILNVIIGKRGDRLYSSFAVISPIPSGDHAISVGPLKFASDPGTLGVIFPRELSYADLFEVPEVTLGGGGGSFKLGPAVFATCQDLLMAAADVQIFPAQGAEDFPVLINVGSIVSENLRIRVIDPARLIVTGESLQHPWSQYQQHVSLDAFARGQQEAYLLYLELRRLVLRFKNAKKGEAGIFQPLMDNLVIGENRRARIVMDYLQDIGCVELRGHMYLLKLAEFGKLGISQPALRELEYSPPVLDLAQKLMHYAATK